MGSKKGPVNIKIHNPTRHPEFSESIHLALRERTTQHRSGGSSHRHRRTRNAKFRRYWVADGNNYLFRVAFTGCCGLERHSYPDFLETIAFISRDVQVSIDRGALTDDRLARSLLLHNREGWGNSKSQPIEEKSLTGVAV